MLDLLECRRLLSVSYDSASGALSVVGTDRVDSVIFSEEILRGAEKKPHKVLRLHFNGEIFDYKRGTVSSISIETLAGGDTVILGTIEIPSTINGGPGDDKLSGGDARDVINGQGGDDYIYGRKGNDYIVGGIGNDLMLGGPHNDHLVPFSGENEDDDTVSGGRGSDTVDYSASPRRVIAFVGGIEPAKRENDKLLVGLETLIGSAFDDVLVNSTPNPMLIIGGAGNDTITGGSGLDTLDGGAGNDVLAGKGNSDTFIANDGESDTIDGGSGADSAELIDLIDVVTNVP